MKKIVTFLLLLTISISSFAQIQRNILGLTLGKTTKASAMSILKRKGYKLEYNDGNYVCFKPTTFGGVTWEGFEVDFNGNKVSCIMFRLTYTKEDKLSSYYYNILGKLAKYNNYKGSTYNEDFEKSQYYSDKTTEICLRQTYLPSSLYLRYMYLKADNSQDGADDL